MGVAENKELVERFYELMNARRFDEMWELFATDATWGGGGCPPKVSGSIDRMREIMVDPMPIFVDGGIHFTLHAMIGEEDRVAAEAESFAELVNGEVYNNSYHMLFTIKDGKITDVKEYGDTLHAKEVFVDSGVLDGGPLGFGDA